MTRTSNSSPDGTRVTREETEEGDELVSSTGGGICPAEVDGGDGPMGDTAEISAFLGRREQGDSVAADVEGGASTSSASAGLCLVDDDEGPMDVAQISATLEQQDLAEKAKAQRINSQTSSAAISPASTSSASADVCLVDDVEGPMDVARISATLELQDLAEKAEAQRINSHTSSAAIPPPRSATSVSPSRRESSASSAQRSLAETNMAVSTPDQESTIPPADGDGLYGRASAQRALRMEIAGCESVPSSIMAEAYTVPDSPVFTASIVEVIPWYKQKRYVCILMMVMILIIGIAAVAGVLLVDGKQPPDEVEMVEITSIIYVNVTDGPTETPTGQPTTIPSSEPSYLPTYSPTVHVCAAPIGQPNSVTPSANLCGTTVMQPTNLETSHLCNCTDSPAVIVNGTGVEFNLNSFAIACIAGSQPAIVVVGESNSVLGRQTKQTSWERTGARGGICGSPVTRIKILLQGSGNHTVRDLILVLSEDSSLDQVGVEMESSGNTVDNCDIGSPFTPNPMLDSDPGNQVGVEMRGDNNVLSNNYISVRRDLADNYGTKTIGVRSSGNDCLLIGNTFSEGRGGIVLKQGSCQVIDNHISAQQDIWAIEVSGGTHTLSGNTITHSEYGIIFLSNSGLLGPESVIENNTISDSSESCIYLQSAYGFIIKRNTMERCQNDAILLVRSPTNVTIESNTLVDSKWGIVASDATSLAASNNTIYNSSTGIQFQGSTSRSSIIGNSIQKCNNSAIYLRDSHHVTVKDNTLVDSKWGIDGINATYLAVSNNAIRNMILDGIQLKNSTSSSISGNSINNCGEPAISLFYSSDITIENNTLLESRHGISSFEVTSLAVRNNIISNITDDGMHFERSSSSSISGNLIQNCTDKAIALLNLTDVTVENNTLVDSNWGIYSTDATSLVASYNYISNMKEDGIQLKNSTSSSISGNSINNCGDPAISLFYSSDITIENNTLLESWQGILGEDATSLAVRNNIISNITDDGIRLLRSPFTSIIDNAINNCGVVAIYLQDSSHHVTVNDNTLVDSKWVVWSNNSTFLAISNNSIWNASFDGIGLVNAASSSVSGNSINNCNGSAISLLDSSYDVSIEDNTLDNSEWGIEGINATSLAISNNAISNSSIDGIYLKDAASSSISGNQIQDCVRSAVVLFHSSNVTFTANTLVDNKWGIYSKNSTFLVVEKNTISCNSHIGMQLWNMFSGDIRGNIVNGNEAVGILLLESGLDTKIVNNSVNGNYGGGIKIAGSGDTLIAGNLLDSNKGPGISLCAESQEFEEYFEDANHCISNELIENTVTASANASEIYIGEGSVGTVLKGNVAADEEDDQLLIDNQSPTTFISSDNVPNFTFTLVGPGHCQDSLSQLYDFATFVLENTTLAECEAACGNYDKTDNLVGFEVSSLACFCLFENGYLLGEIPGTLGTCPSSADQCSIATEGSGVVSSSLLSADEDQYCYKKANFAELCVFCSKGLTVDAKTSLPVAPDGVTYTCGQLYGVVNFVKSGSDECIDMLMAEPLCCPSSSSEKDTSVPINSTDEIDERADSADESDPREPDQDSVQSDPTNVSEGDVDTNEDSDASH